MNQCLRGGKCKFDSCTNLIKGIGGFMSPKDFSDRLLIELESRGMKPAEFSEKVGISRTAIYHYKIAFPTVENLIKIAEFLDVSVDYLLGRTVQRKVVDDIRNSIFENDPKLVEFINYINDTYLKNSN